MGVTEEDQGGGDYGGQLQRKKGTEIRGASLGVLAVSMMGGALFSLRVVARAPELGGKISYREARICYRQYQWHWVVT